MFFPKRKLIVLLAVFFLILFFFFISSQSASYALRFTFTDVSELPLKMVNFLSQETRAVLFFHRSYWDNLKLKQENEELKTALLNQEKYEAENERLKNLLELKQSSTFGTVAAFVIGKDFNAFRPYLIVDKGSLAGIKKYAPVLTPLGLVGKIAELGRFSAKVMLINDPDLSVPAANERTGEQGLVSGTLDGRCKLRFLDRDSDIKVGDLIVTSGLNMTYPKGILIGRVKWVGLEPSGLGKMAILEPAIGISSLQEILITTSY